MPVMHPSKFEVSRWVDEGGAGPDIDNVPPAVGPGGRALRRWSIFACSALVVPAAVLVAYRFWHP